MSKKLKISGSPLNEREEDGVGESSQMSKDEEDEDWYGGDISCCSQPVPEKKQFGNSILRVGRKARKRKKKKMSLPGNLFFFDFKK